MRVPLSWLREYVEIALPPAELAQRLTLAGVEVAGVEEIGAGWENIYVGRIERIEPHPDADRLTLVTVDYGRKPIRVVTGATNIKLGDKVPVALVGARLYSPRSGKIETLKAGKIRGVTSEGMICAEDELCLGDDHEGILILDEAAPIGAELRRVLGDVIFDLEITPNRSDCLSVIGIAREVAALTGQRVRYPVVELVEGGPPARELVRVDIEAPDLCPRYTALVIRGVRIGPSPAWLQARLEAVGVRPINNVVDVTNYVMLEMGQPLHAFDMDRVAGRHIIVRRAAEGEVFTTLDDQARRLTGEMLMIADERGSVAVAGVMGGLDSEVTEATRDILLESANFDPISVRRTARALRLTTEASRRFERGQSPEQTLPAARRAAQLIQQLAGGDVAPGEADAYPGRAAPPVVHLAEREIPRLLGIPFDRERVRGVFESLEMTVREAPGGLEVAPPHWRLDVRLPADLVEEYARISGYEQIPATMLTGAIPEPDPAPDRAWERLTKNLLVAAGYSEIITYSLTNEARTQRLLPARLLKQPEGDGGGATALPAVMDYRLLVAGVEPLAVLNPLSEDMRQLRITTLPNMLETLAANLRHEPCVQLFELGRIYLPRDGDLPEERRVLTLGSGQLRPGRGLGERVETDFFDLKGALEELFDRLGVRGRAWQPIRHPSFAAGRAAAIVVAPEAVDGGRKGGAQPVRRADGDGDVVGVVGEVAREVREQFEIDQPVWLAYVDFEALLRLARDARRFEPIPRFPPAIQDIAVVVDEEMPVAEVQRVIQAAGGRLVRNVALFDVYRGDQVPAGKKSLAFSITYQAEDRTLTDAEVQKIRANVERQLAREVGAELRR